MFSLELPLQAAAVVNRAVPAAIPPTSEDDPPPPDNDDIDDTEDRSCTSYRRDSCELVLISKLDKLLFFTFNRLTLTPNRLGDSLLLVGFTGFCECCFCWCC